MFLIYDKYSDKNILKDYIGGIFSEVGYAELISKNGHDEEYKYYFYNKLPIKASEILIHSGIITNKQEYYEYKEKRDLHFNLYKLYSYVSIEMYNHYYKELLKFKNVYHFYDSSKITYCSRYDMNNLTDENIDIMLYEDEWEGENYTLEERIDYGYASIELLHEEVSNEEDAKVYNKLIIQREKYNSFMQKWTDVKKRKKGFVTFDEKWVQEQTNIVEENIGDNKEINRDLNRLNNHNVNNKVKIKNEQNSNNHYSSFEPSIINYENSINNYYNHFKQYNNEYQSDEEEDYSSDSSEEDLREIFSIGNKINKELKERCRIKAKNIYQEIKEKVSNCKEKKPNISKNKLFLIKKTFKDNQNNNNELGIENSSVYKSIVHNNTHTNYLEKDQYEEEIYVNVHNNYFDESKLLFEEIEKSMINEELESLKLKEKIDKEKEKMFDKHKHISNKN